MLLNLEAEQARHKKSDEDVAKILGIRRETYCKKKKSHDFRFKEIIILCNVFSCDFNYLFKITEESA